MIILLIALVLEIGCHLDVHDSKKNFIIDKQYRLEFVDTFSVYHSSECVPIFVSTIKYAVYDGKIRRKANIGVEFDYLNLIIESQKDTVIKAIHNNTGKILLCIPVVSKEQDVYLLYGLIPFKLSDYVFQDSVYTTVCNGMYGVKVYKLCSKDEFTGTCLGILNNKVKVNELFYLHYYIKITSLDKEGNGNSRSKGFCISDKIVSILNLITI